MGRRQVDEQALCGGNDASQRVKPCINAVPSGTTRRVVSLPTSVLPEPLLPTFPLPNASPSQPPRSHAPFLKLARTRGSDSLGGRRVVVDNLPAIGKLAEDQCEAAVWCFSV